MSENMNIYTQVQNTPQEARKTIGAGRLKGYTDINPMWRIKRLTEVFGPCGIGWWYEITDKRIEEGANGERKAFVDINLYYEWNGKTSKPIPGTGGSSLVASEKNGLYTNDECFKMALTDAIGIACKALGMSADIYFEKDRSKYDLPDEPSEPKPSASSAEKPLTDNEIAALQMLMKEKGVTVEQILSRYQVDNLEKLTGEQYLHCVNGLKGMKDK